MTKNRKFNGKPTTRLITSIERATVDRIDALIAYPRGNRAEFVRRAIERELERRQSDDYWTP